MKELKENARAVSVLVALGGEKKVLADRRAEAWLSVAEIQQAEKNLEAAVNALAKVVELAERQDLKRRGYLLRGQLLVDLGRLAEGVQFLKKFVTASPSDPLSAQLQLGLSEILLNSGSNEMEAVEFQAYLETYSGKQGQAKACHGKGWALYNLGRFAEAATAFEKAYVLFEDSTDRARSLFKAADARFANAHEEEG